MDIWQHVSTALHILGYHQNVVNWRVLLNYMRTPLIQYYLESSRKASYMETQISKFILNV